MGLAMDSSIDAPAAEGVQYELNRAAVMEWLYCLDGRQEPTHPDHSLYTGLAGKYRLKLGSLALECLTRGWHEEGPRAVVIYAEDAA